MCVSVLIGKSILCTLFCSGMCYKMDYTNAASSVWCHIVCRRVKAVRSEWQARGLAGSDCRHINTITTEINIIIIIFASIIKTMAITCMSTILSLLLWPFNDASLPGQLDTTRLFPNRCESISTGFRAILKFPTFTTLNHNCKKRTNMFLT